MALESSNSHRGPTRHNVSQDMLKAICLLEHIYKGERVQYSELETFFGHAGFKENDPEKNRQIAEAVKRSSLPVRSTDDDLFWADLFDDEPVGRRMYQDWQRKVNMAGRVVDMLIEQRPKVKSLFLGAGTSALAVTRATVARIKNRRFESLDSVYTNSLLAMNELVRHKLPIEIHVPEGEIVMQDGAIMSNEGIDNLDKIGFDAVVTGFYGLSFSKGFSSIHQTDKKEKCMNLRPSNCSKIFIVLTWEKIGISNKVVATVTEGIDEKKRYFIVTDPPEGWMQRADCREQRDEIDKWDSLVKREVVQFVFVERPE